jgi:hypothetical protein
VEAANCRVARETVSCVDARAPAKTWVYQASEGSSRPTHLPPG